MTAPAGDRAFTGRLARYCARNPIALGRLAYQEQDGSVTYHSDKPTGPTAGSETTDTLEFHFAVGPHVVGELHRRHPALAELALDPVAVGQGER